MCVCDLKTIYIIVCFYFESLKKKKKNPLRADKWDTTGSWECVCEREREGISDNNLTPMRSGITSDLISALWGQESRTGVCVCVCVREEEERKRRRRSCNKTKQEAASSLTGNIHINYRRNVV